MDKKLLKNKSKHLVPVMNIGKNGITEGAIKQLEIDFSTKELIKIKFLRTYLEEKEIKPKQAAEKLASMTSSEIIDVVGFTASFYKQKKSRF